MNVVRVAHQAAVHHIAGPHIDWTALSPLIVLTAGGLLVLLVGLLRPALVREWIVPGLTVLTFLGAVAAAIVVFDHHPTGKAGFCVVAAPGCGSAPLAMDRLALELYMLFSVAGVATVLMSWRGIAIRESGHGEWGGLLIFSVLGMCVFVSAQNLITLFLGIELLSIPLYILCASETRREGSLESGLKYLIVGSVGSATLVYGLGLIYGATGSTDFATIGSALSQGKLAGGGTAMVFTGLALTIVGFAFKASVAPFHQWTPDVYEGAPTAITAFMATATKAAALGAFLRFFDVAAIGAQHTWAPMLATVAAITIVVGNVGALGQSSLKRMMGYSGVGQAGYMLSGVVVGSRLGIQATVLYLIAYLFMNLAPFAVIVAEEHERPDGDYLSGLAGLGTRRPWLAWPMTIGMLGLAGIPGTVGFIGKFQLINALVSGAYTWLAIVLVIGSMISLGYYLRVVATIWMRPPVAAPSPAAAATGPGELAPIAGGSPDADEWEEGPGSAGAALAYPELVFVAVAFATAVIFFGIFPSPLFNFTAHAASALSGLF
ncbi:MAG: NADH-quinone oxidoreductase subunit N [Solirubrobacterales bacterium]|nr:NADH-quinone oxidoreductase subunit N [Solirubrobacterales bacterium]MBV8947579.1 NADH-quinone oxidoreductase subunit N [Solirubrobacterales bacterium]MBV9684830.1 NADH-quinone oxidoreductase subunit N [Solirubrobacterales bacterium]